MRPALPWYRQPEYLTIADQITWALPDPTRIDRPWRHGRFKMLPEHFHKPVANAYLDRWHKDGSFEANIYLLQLTAQIEHFVLRPTSTYDDLISLAKRAAEVSGSLLRATPSRVTSLRTIVGLCRRYELNPPLGITKDEADPKRIKGAIRRVSCEYWWRRQLRRKHLRVLEAFAVQAHLVHRHANIYVSQDTYLRHQAQKRRNALILQSLFAQNENGDEFSLAELAERSTANPRNRHNELMVRIAGFDFQARSLGHVGLFLTLTCPSAMHAMQAHNGKQNPRYDGKTTARDAQAYLTKLWAQIRASLNRKNIRPYGFRIAEPHHDGTPHWHLLLFIESAKADALIACIRTYALRAEPDEPGAQKHRFTCEYIDPNKGSAAGYLAKYITKNTDGIGMEDEADGDHSTSAQRVVAWASTWGIRQFQQIGGPSVSVWRELRRLGSCNDEDTAPDLHRDDVGEATLGQCSANVGETTLGLCRAAADVGDWAGYVSLQGGPQAKRSDQPVRLIKREIEKEGRYGEPVAPQIVGVECGAVIQLTRLHEWKVTQRRQERSKGEQFDTAWHAPATESPIATVLLGEIPSYDDPPGAGAVGKAAGRAAWSSVNNCTQHQLQTELDQRTFQSTALINNSSSPQNAEPNH